MPDTFVKIATVTVGVGGSSSASFTSIPATYTDLKVLASTRQNNTGMRVQFNSDTGTNYSWRRLDANGTVVTSNSNTTYGSPYNTFIYWSMQGTTTDTANTFSNGEMYIPNYAGSTQKSVSADSVAENNATTAYMAMQAGLWTGTAAITSITLSPDTSTLPLFEQYSTFTLYGISKT
jgi:hypothetical protein